MSVYSSFTSILEPHEDSDYAEIWYKLALQAAVEGWDLCLCDFKVDFMGISQLNSLRFHIFLPNHMWFSEIKTEYALDTVSK